MALGQLLLNRLRKQPVLRRSRLLLKQHQQRSQLQVQLLQLLQLRRLRRRLQLLAVDIQELLLVHHLMRVTTERFLRQLRLVMEALQMSVHHNPLVHGARIRSLQ